MIIRRLNLAFSYFYLQLKDEIGVYAVKKCQANSLKSLVTVPRQIHQCVLFLRCRFCACANFALNYTTDEG